MKPRVTAEELAEMAGISVATLFKTAKVLRDVLERAAEDKASVDVGVAVA